MKKSVIIKMVTILVTTCILINYIPTISKASWITNAFGEAKDFITENTSDVELKMNEAGFQESVESLSDNIYGILLAIAIFAAVIIIMIIGIKFMVGSVAEKAKVKEMLIPYIVGCIVVFGSFGIWKLAISIMATVV